MKKLYTILIIFIWSFTNAQCIMNGSLDATCLSNNGITCIGNWQATHGSPSSSGVVNSNTWVWMWSHSNRGEGIYTNYNFVQGQNYQISFDIKTDTNISNPNNTVLNSLVLVKAFNGLTTSSGDAVPANLISNGQVILQSTIATYRSNNWTRVTINYVPNQNYTQLCFFPYMNANSRANGSAQVEMEIDNIEVIPPFSFFVHELTYF